LNNVIAAGIEGVLYAPFHGADGVLNINSILVSLGATGIAAGATTGVAISGALAGAVLAGPGTVIGVLALAGTALLGALLALFLLVVRRVVILFLVLTAPIALAAWILPGTQKLWKLWWESFAKLLLVYPMILGLVAAGKIAAYVASKSTNGFLGFFIIIICYFGPLFLIPALLKLSGVAFATITGAVNNRGKGAFDRLRNVRANEAKKNKAKFMAGERFNDRNPFARRINNLGKRANAGMGGRFGIGSRGKAVMEANSALAAAEAEKTNPLFAANKEDEKVMKLLAMHGTRGRAKQWIAKEAESLRAAGKHEDAAKFEKNFGDALETASAIGFNSKNRRAAIMSGGAISYGFKDGEEGWKEATGAMKEMAGLSADTPDEVAAQNQTYRNLMNQFQYNAKGMGRSDLAGAVDGGSYSGDRAWKSLDLYQTAHGKPDSIKGAGKHFVKKMESGNFDDQADAAVFYKELDAMLPNATGAVRDEILKQKELLEMAGVTDFLSRKTGETEDVIVRDPNDPNKLVKNPNGPKELTIEDALSRGKISGKRIRTYERPDPNKLES
jgi:hypothetical protein